MTILPQVLVSTYWENIPISELKTVKSYNPFDVNQGDTRQTVQIVVTNKLSMKADVLRTLVKYNDGNRVLVTYSASRLFLRGDVNEELRLKG